MKRMLARLACLLIVAALTLSGCNLIGTDRIMELDQMMAAAKEKFSGVIATYEGGEITQEDVMANFASQYTYMNQFYSQYYGTSITADMLASIEQDVALNAVQNVAVARQMEARGLSLDEAKLAEVQQEADEIYQQAYDSFYASAEGNTEEIKAKQTEYDMYTQGYTREAFYNITLANHQREMIEEAVKGEITEVTDEELQAAFDQKVASDQESYTNSPSLVGSMMTSDTSTVYWMPEGYRTVKHILVVPEADVLSAVTDARTALSEGQAALDALKKELEAASGEGAEDTAAETAEAAEPARSAEEIQADIDKAEADLKELQAAVDKAEADCLASVQDKIDEIYAKLADGADFEALIEEYGEDPGMKNEPTKTRGYYVCAESANWDKNFTAGAMALEKVGDVSEKPVISGSGIHIIRYESDVTPGAVSLDDVREKLTQETLEDMKSEHFATEMDGWVAELKPEYHLDAFKLN